MTHGQLEKRIEGLIAEENWAAVQALSTLKLAKAVENLDGMDVRLDFRADHNRLQADVSACLWNEAAVTVEVHE